MWRINELPDNLRIEYDSIREETEDFAEEIQIAINRATKISHRRHLKIKIGLEKIATEKAAKAQLEQAKQEALPAPTILEKSSDLMGSLFS